MEPICRLTKKDTSWNWFLRTRPGNSKCAVASNQGPCSMFLWSLKEPYHTVWCQPEWPWHSDASEWQAYGACKSFLHCYRNTVCSNIEGDAGNCLHFWAFKPVHIWLTWIHQKRPQATRNDSTETTHPSTSMPPVMMMMLQKYNVTMHYKHSKNMHADMLSRVYLPPQRQKWTTLNQSKWSVICPYLTSD